MTQADVLELIAHLEELFCSSGLPEAQTAEAIKHLEAAKEEAQEGKSDKNFAVKNLQRAMKVFNEASETMKVGANLWNKVQPIITKLLPWLDVASGIFT